ncbi:MAG: hypothetical protein HYY90_01780, partial [Candidatus Omnitrophica bacterium]|nr:hypothetical protein [Candidatus Omnitrophota bacterium]
MYSYDVLSRRTRTTFPNGLEAASSYDQASQLLSLVHRLIALPSTIVARVNYTYDAVGNRTTLTDLAGEHRFTYDALNRLTGALHLVASGLVPETYAYDPVGNRLSSHLSATSTHDSANRLLEDATFTYTYDANG